MGFISFVGRVFSTSLFLLSAYQQYLEFGEDGRPALHAFHPKYHVFTSHITACTGLKLPEVEAIQVLGVAA